MSAYFDPYHKWLGILPKDQPPHHYRLLGVETFEDDLQVIEAAADRQLGFLRKFQSGEHAADCQKLLNEVSRARLCLLKPAAKAAYDDQLRDQLEMPSEELIEFEPLVATTGRSRSSGGPGPVAWASVGLLVLLVVGGLAFLFRGKGGAQKPDQPAIAVAEPGTKSPETGFKADAKTSSAAKIASVAPRPNAAGEISLLPLLKSENIVAGSWHMKPDRLESLDAISRAQVSLPVNVPAEYTLHITATRLEHSNAPTNTCAVGLVCGENNCIFAMEVDPKTGVSGVELLDGRPWNNNSTTVPGLHTKVGQPFQLDAIVRKEGIEIRIDGRTVVDWQGTFNRLHRAPRHWDQTDPKQLFVAAESKYVFNNITLGPPLPRRKLPGGDLKPGDSVELLKFVDLKQDVWNGDWLKDGITLKSGTTADFSRFSVPYQVPEEYELVVDFQSELPIRNFYVGLPFQEGHAGLGLGGDDAQINVLVLDLAAYFRDPFIYHNGQILTAPRNQLKATVRKNHLKIQVGDLVLFDWRGDPRRFVAINEWTTPGNRVTVGCRNRNSAYQIHSLKLTRLASATDVFSKPLAPRDGDLLSIVDVDRDTTHGVWTKSAAGVLSSAERSAGLRFPAQLPADYDFRFVVERKAGTDSLSLALPVGQRRVQVIMDGWGGRTSGIDQIEGRNANENSTTLNLPESNFPLGRPTLVQGRVAGRRLTLEVNGTKRWDLDIPETLSDPITIARPGWLTPQETLQVFFNSWESSFEIVEARFRPLDRTAPPFPSLNIAGLPKSATSNNSTPGGNPPAPNSDQPLVGEGLLSTGTTPVPDAAAQEIASKKLRELFREQYANSKKDPEKLGLSQKLEKLAEETSDDPAVKFVCLDEARKLAADAGDLTRAFSLVEALSTEFKIDVLELKSSTLKTAAPKLKGPLLNKEFVDKALPLVDQLILAEQFEQAINLASVTAQAAIKVKDKPLQAEVQDVRKEADELAKEFALAEKARQTLLTRADDGPAKLVWGRWVCLHQNKWTEGLKILQGAGDEQLSELASRDLKDPADKEAIVQLGTDWLDYAKSRKDHSLNDFATRALYWLSKAQADATGLAKTRIESLMEQAVSTRDWNSPMTWLLEAIGKKVSQRKYVMSQETRHDDGKLFQDLPAEGAILIGFNCRMGNWYQYRVIKAMQPVYATKLGVKLGEWHGRGDEPIIEIRARPGYAVCDITSNVGAGVDWIQITFARVTRTGLDPQRRYISAGVGGIPVPGAGNGLLNTQPVIGVFGHADDFWRGFGLIIAK